MDVGKLVLMSCDVFNFRATRNLNLPSSGGACLGLAWLNNALH